MSYYKEESFSIDEDEDLSTLRQSAKRDSSVNEIRKILPETSHLQMALRNSVVMPKDTDTVRRFAVCYGTYMNTLCYPMKFIKIEQAEKIGGIEHLTPIYLIYKKCYNEVKEFYSIVKKKVNFLKF